MPKVSALVQVREGEFGASDIYGDRGGYAVRRLAEDNIGFADGVQRAAGEERAEAVEGEEEFDEGAGGVFMMRLFT